jgi:hypothetical protein
MSIEEVKEDKPKLRVKNSMSGIKTDKIIQQLSQRNDQQLESDTWTKTASDGFRPNNETSQESRHKIVVVRSKNNNSF